MRSKQILMTCLGTIFLFFILTLCTAQARENVSGNVIKVVDGDTITVLTPDNRQMKVRLYGIDCPEKKQAFGNAAKRFATEWIAGKKANVEVVDIDRYGRVVGVVFDPKGESLNKALLTNGLAWVYTRYCAIPDCREWKKIEIKARAERVGLWNDKKPIEPWKWRKMQRTKNNNY